MKALAHHWSVLKSAWALENERRAQARALDETQFLPAALEVMETPPSPALRALLLALSGLVVVALLWSLIGRLDVVAVAPGKTVPDGQVKIIQWGGGSTEIGSTGVVRAIHVREGQEVKKGQVLVELDPTVAGAEEAQATRGLLAATIERAKARVILAYLDGKDSSFDAPPGTPDEVARVQRLLIKTEIREYEAKRAGLMEARRERRAELQVTKEEIAKIEGTLPFLQKQVDARRELAAKGLSSKLLLWELEEQLVERQRNLKIQTQTATKAKAAIANLDMQLVELKQTFAKESIAKLAEAEDNASLRQAELQKSETRRGLQVLRSPVSGTVQQLAVHTIGGVVQPAQALMMIVPDDSDLIVEAQVLNKDRGFVREGQTVRVKFEAFPFTDYGLIEGRVEQISRDAVASDADSASEKNAKRTPNQSLVYAARIRLNKKVMHVGDVDIPLGPGMAVQAEIKTGTRRIIQYLLSPIMKTVEEAGRER